MRGRRDTGTIIFCLGVSLSLISLPIFLAVSPHHPISPSRFLEGQLRNDIGEILALNTMGCDLIEISA